MYSQAAGAVLIIRLKPSSAGSRSTDILAELSVPPARLLEGVQRYLGGRCGGRFRDEYVRKPGVQ